MRKRFVDASGEEIAIPGQVDASVTCHDGTVLVQRDGVYFPVLATRNKDQVWLSRGDGTGYVTAEAKRRGGTDDAGSAVIAPMTGRVVVVSVAVGDKVERGQPVVVIEAMKMEQPLKAPRDGVVEAVKCETGQLVDGGVVLVALAKEEA